MASSESRIVPEHGRRWIVIPAVAAGLILLPHILSFSQQEVLVFLTINVLLVASYRLLTLTGEWSLGHVVFMGVGAYASALFSKTAGLPVPLAMPLGALVAAGLAYLLSFPLFRMKGFYFLIGSFAAGEVVRLLWIKFRIPFGGPKGLKLIPALIVVTISLAALYRIEHSRIGLTFHAVHWQDPLASSIGVDTRHYRTLALVMASFFAGLAGTLLAHYIGTVNPNRFDVEEMVFVLIWVIVGGTRTFLGPILGVVILTVLNEVVLRELGTEAFRPLIYGALLIIAILFLPEGLESLAIRLRERFVGARPTTAPEQRV